ncbi:MAG: glycoside hydrolase family 44 protein [Thermoplasmata archaeon]|nr:glycoside hydrolase family 44 protein [Thermoplasmata archaeon]
MATVSSRSNRRRLPLAPRGRWRRNLFVALAVVLMFPALADAQAARASVPVVVSPDLGAALAPVLTVANASTWTMSASFWGADVRVYYPLGSTQSNAFNATPIEYARWPGGAVADSYNYTANEIYSVGGGGYSPPSNETQFIGWCRLVGCHAILQLPAEINDPATAAYYVRYTTTTLHFRPAYWEIGNEPALWSHYGFPWSQWLGSQNVNATPGTYAATVRAYATAIHAVDATARIIGLAGVGTGGYNEDTWIRATVQLNGPNLSAVAIHVYPAAATNGTTPVTLASYFGFLEGKSSLPYRVPRDRAAILTACATCTRIQLFVTELGTGSAGGLFASYMAGFPAVPFTAAEVAQAISDQVPNVDLFALQSNYSGSLLNTTGAPSPVDLLYSQMLVHLQPIVLNFTLTSTPAHFYVVPARNAGGTSYSLLAVNANASRAVRITFAGTAFPIGDPGTYWSWNQTSAAPVSSSWTIGLGPTSFLLPPRSVLVIQVA